MQISPLLARASRISALVIIALGASAAVGAAEAKTIPLHGTYTADDIKKHCDAAGGTFNHDGYGCSTNCKGGPAAEDGSGSVCSVNCSLTNKCKGYVPRKLPASNKKLPEILGHSHRAQR